MKSSAIVEGKTCHVLSAFDRARVLVDADEYYSAFCQAALRARRHIYISGWQFDTQARLLRPDPAAPPAHPIELLPFLNHLCEVNPALEIYITAWDYSVLYALEREWLQKLKFDFQSHSRVHFEFLKHPNPGGCHHQKLVIIDGRVAFVGGLDLCDSRWDTRRHSRGDPARIDTHGKPYKPFHDIQVGLEGPVVSTLEQIFLHGWRMAGGLPPALPLADAPHLQAVADGATSLQGSASLLGEVGSPLAGRRVAVSRTEWTDDGQVVGEIQALFERAILDAERLIYIETQYFTSKALAEALYYRLADPARSKLQVVLVMPDGADSPKEDFVLGNRQRAVRRFVADVSRHFGHVFRLLMSSETTDDAPCPATFIHSKLMIVDDEFLTIGSANFTNRSLRIDREVNVAWQAHVEQGADATRLIEDISALRASLLAEHAGVEDEGLFREIDGLIERIDGVCGHGTCKLRCQAVPAPEDDDPLLIAIFDPSGPIDWSSIDQSLEEAFEFDEGIVKRAAQKLGQRLGVIDIE
jgi:phosphatidylserine/phosphatidylglycerophosphate/cardiolipin synthase-like enzyme